MKNEKQIVENSKPDVARMERKIGTMTYLVGVHFNENSKMDVGDKLKRVMLHDLEKKVAKNNKKTLYN